MKCYINYESNEYLQIHANIEIYKPYRLSNNLYQLLESIFEEYIKTIKLLT